MSKPASCSTGVKAVLTLFMQAKKGRENGLADDG
jgi:hypothetical protein